MSDRDDLCINTLRMLAVDTVQKAESGHPGMPMGAATLAYVLWTRHLRHSPAHPSWPDRDRFVLSAGHASALLYSLLHLTGYDLTLDDLKQFRQWESRTPGHPERGCAPGVEVSTGPLGQGLGNALGLAMAERWLAATFNRPGHEIVDHHTYVLASDGDMMEGISSEVASLAGTLRLGRLIVVYDANQVTLSATTDLTFTEDVGARFEACGWHVQRIDGMDVDAVDAALRPRARRRSAVADCRAHAHRLRQPEEAGHLRRARRAARQGRSARHQACAGMARGAALPRAGRGASACFAVRGGTRRGAGGRVAAPCGRASRRAPGRRETPSRARWRANCRAGWQDRLPDVHARATATMATRDAGGKVLNALAGVVTNLVGGSADLNPSTKTALAGLGDFEGPQHSADARRAEDAGHHRRRLGLRGAQHPLRRARARDGGRGHRHGRARRRRAVRRPPSCRSPTTCGRASGSRRSARPTSSTCGRTTASRWAKTARRISRSSSWPACARFPGMLVLRPSDATETVGGVARGAVAPRRSRGPRAHAAEAAGARSHGARAGVGAGERRLRAGGARRGARTSSSSPPGPRCRSRSPRTTC